VRIRTGSSWRLIRPAICQPQSPPTRPRHVLSLTPPSCRPPGRQAEFPLRGGARSGLPRAGARCGALCLSMYRSRTGQYWAVTPFTARSARLHRAFCTGAAPAWAPPFAQVPRPEHTRRSTENAAPSSCERYAIRSFLLTDSVAYAPEEFRCVRRGARAPRRTPSSRAIWDLGLSTIRPPVGHFFAPRRRLPKPQGRTNSMPCKLSNSFAQCRQMGEQ
jgi:hypothetical protein